ncbi:MAG: UDP-N-acetylmuramoyl-tripeptide--D-alanyl-D-alanine ligase, partial [Bacteroidia bacterium]|nr:UDP-N-acetylmuramoyl-tripeptide--D-alanyl-D-alanine ligase [Bacteroidia bacterium]
SKRAFSSTLDVQIPLSMKPASLQFLLDTFLAHRNVSTDTRKIQQGDLYWALKGANFNGNLFAPQALEAGAAKVVVDDPAVIVPGDERYVLVEDGLRGLQALATAFRKTWTIPVIGLTGSNGKTTTKELLAAALSTKYVVHATAGNYNNHIGVPLTILAYPDEAEIAIIEMGTNQPGDILELAEIALPSHGLITNVGYAHLEKLLSLDGVMVEKGQLFEVVKQQQGALFVNADDHRVVQAAGAYEPIISFGRDKGDFQASIRNQSSAGMVVQVEYDEWAEPVLVSSAMSGSHNALNIAAAAAVANHFQVAPSKIAAGIGAYLPANHRSQLIERDGYQIWMDAYNANPSSMAASIRHVMSLQAGRIGLVIGDMYELGEASEELHTELGQLIKNQSPHLVIGIGKEIQYTLAQLETPVHHFSNTQEAIPHLKELVSDCDLLLLKASRGIGLEKLLVVI